jgi:hypothetical protein
MDKLSRFVFLLPLLFAAVAPARGMAAVQTSDFLVNTTDQLVSLCSAKPNDPLVTPALNFCHGFAVGVTRTLQEEDLADPRAKPMFCLPANGVDRNQALSAFLQWVSADPSRMSMSAADGIAGFLAANYPCGR